MKCSKCGRFRKANASGKALCAKCRSHEDRQRMFNLSKTDYAILMEKQNGLCAICRQPEIVTGPGGKVISLAVDHDHNCCPGRTSCGKCVRGLLCKRCNRGIGFFEERTDFLESALQYLEQYR